MRIKFFDFPIAKKPYTEIISDRNLVTSLKPEHLALKPIDLYGRSFKSFEELLVKHQMLLKDFPHFVEIEDFHFGAEAMMSVATKSFGYPNGECIDDELNVVCPLADKHEVSYLDRMIEETIDHIEKSRGKKLSKSMKHSIAIRISSEENLLCLDHSHLGDWEFLYVGKTGYDYGHYYFYFREAWMLDAWRVKCTLSHEYDLI